MGTHPYRVCLRPIRVIQLGKHFLAWLILMPELRYLPQGVSVEHFAQVARARGDVIIQTQDIRSRLSQALRLVDEIAGAPSGGPRERLTDRCIERLLMVRRKREQFFGSALFADPAWDILLALYAAELRQHRLSVSNLEAETGVPPTTVLRWINTLETKGLVCRTDDPRDARRVFVALTADAVTAMDQFFASAAAQVLLI
jgi:DNA-binding MarR family transcriptional regulator